MGLLHVNICTLSSSAGSCHCIICIYLQLLHSGEEFLFEGLFQGCVLSRVEEPWYEAADCDHEEWPQMRCGSAHRLERLVDTVCQQLIASLKKSQKSLCEHPCRLLALQLHSGHHYIHSRTEHNICSRYMSIILVLNDDSCSLKSKESDT
jgi:hypothetical protein